MKLTLFILLFTTVLNAQTFNTSRKFSGTIDSLQNITWITDESTVNNQLTITKDTIFIENKKYYYCLNDTIEKTSFHIAIYSTDHLGSKCIILIEEYFKFKYIYFQYQGSIFGYIIRN